MEQELNNGVDEFSQEVMISQIELMLSYVNRFYKHQFITQKVVNSALYQENNKDQNFNELHLYLVRFLTFLCRLPFRKPQGKLQSILENNKKEH